jgi:uncharacterized protein HemY
LGWFHYRIGNWKSSIAALEKSCKLQTGGMGDSAQWFPLAMAHMQLGEQEKARQWYDRAVQWMDKNQSKLGVLRRFRTEAEELLKLKKKE